MQRSPSKQEELTKAAHAALLRARVTQLEVVIFKTVQQSRMPPERIHSLIAAFNTEDQVFGRNDAMVELSQPVLEFLRSRRYVQRLRAAMV